MVSQTIIFVFSILKIIFKNGSQTRKTLTKNPFTNQTLNTLKLATKLKHS